MATVSIQGILGSGALGPQNTNVNTLHLTQNARTPLRSDQPVDAAMGGQGTVSTSRHSRQLLEGLIRRPTPTNHPV